MAMIDRKELLHHINWVLRPPIVQGWFLDQCTHAIELAAADRGEEIIEIDCKRRTAAEAVEIWELEEFVARERERRCTPEPNGSAGPPPDPVP